MPIAITILCFALAIIAAAVAVRSMVSARRPSSPRATQTDAVAPGEWHRVRRTFSSVTARARWGGIVELLAIPLLGFTLFPAFGGDLSRYGPIVLPLLVIATVFGTLHAGLWPVAVMDARACAAEIRCYDLRGATTFPRSATTLRAIAGGAGLIEHRIELNRDDGTRRTIATDDTGLETLHRLGWL